MTSPASRCLVLPAATGLAAFLLVIATSGPALAQDDDNEMTFEQRIIHAILGGGSNSGIEYRERSPLVIPPSIDLPAPEDASPAARNPAWPRDPEQRQRVVTAPNLPPGRAAALRTDDSLPLLPSELNRGNPPRGAGRVRSPQTDPNLEQGRRLSPSELGYVGGLFRSLWGRNREESVPFTGEPPRTSLTEPPPGYQTPSPNYPYGVQPEKYRPRPTNPFDRGTELY